MQGRTAQGVTQGAEQPLVVHRQGVVIEQVIQDQAAPAVRAQGPGAEDAGPLGAWLLAQEQVPLRRRGLVTGQQQAHVEVLRLHRAPRGRQ